MRKKILVFIFFMIPFLLPPLNFGQLHPYIEAPDQAYTWKTISSTNLESGAVVYELRLTSQKWQGSEWNHILQIIKPSEVKSKQPLVLFFILGSEKQQTAIAFGQKLAQAVGSYVAIVHDIPNQPLFGALREDDLIAYTFLKYLETKDKTWPLLFPMVKAAVRAMDAAEAFLQDEFHTKVSGFVVSGASKRGWTTWLTPAVDKRVKGIIPVVYDNLNLQKQMELHKESWGRFNQEISAYDRQGLPQLLLSGDKSAVTLASMVDPFTYLDKITVPKLIVIGTNDPYWPLGALNIYESALVGQRYILYLPNTGHTFEPSTIPLIDDITVFFQKVNDQVELPRLSWKLYDLQDAFKLNMLSDIPVQQVKSWVSLSKTRDFREAVWVAFPMDKEGRAYSFTHQKPAVGTAAVFGEAIYDVGGRPFTLTTKVWIFEGAGLSNRELRGKKP